MAPLRIALPSKGRLQEPAERLLREAGLRFDRNGRSLSVPVRNMEAEVMFVRVDDVAELVADGAADLGVTGADLIGESGRGLLTRLSLGFGRCSLVVAVPDESPVQCLAELAGASVATSHPRLVVAEARRRGVEVVPIPLRGSVEAATSLGVADAVADLSTTGATLAANSLRRIETLLDSEAVLVSRPDEARPEVNRILTMVDSVLAARERRYLMMNAPADAVPRLAGLIPGLAAPTIIPLADLSMVAFHSVVAADDVWDVLPALKEAGATGILVLPIEQLIA